MNTFFRQNQHKSVINNVGFRELDEMKVYSYHLFLVTEKNDLKRSNNIENQLMIIARLLHEYSNKCKFNFYVNV